MTVEEFIASNPSSLWYLNNHPQIMKLIYKRVVEQYPNNYRHKLQTYSEYNGGSFCWTESEEGHDFWSRIFNNQDLIPFYLSYPKTNKNRID